MQDNEEVIPVRIMKGVDLNINSRLADPGTWEATINLFAYLRGILQLRQGSQLVSFTVAAMPLPQNPFPGGTPGPGAGIPWPPVEQLVVRGAKGASNNAVGGAPNFQGQLPWSGSKSFYTGSTFITKVPEQSVVPAVPGGTFNGNTVLGGGTPMGMRVSALIRDDFPNSGQSRWVGAMSSPLNDFLFFLDPANANRITPIPSQGTDMGYVTSHEGMWQLGRIFNSPDMSHAESDNLFVIIAVNGVDAAMVITPNTTGIGQGATFNSPPFQVSQINFTTNPPDGSGDQMGGYNYVGSTCFCVYGYQIVWGGGSVVSNASAGDTRRIPHFLVFSDPAAPVIKNASSSATPFSQLAAGYLNAQNSASGLYTLQIGDDPDEFVTAVAGSPALTDGFGAQGQLIAWTGFKTVVYNGPLPSSGNPIPAGFGLAVADPVGTWSPKSIAKTQFGTVYLGSDGLVRIVGLDNKIKIIGRALEPLLGGQTQIFYKNCCGFFYKGFYHLFFPQNATDDVNKIEFVADLRDLQLWQSNFNPHDYGVMWFGPMTGRYVNCVAVARDPTSQAVIYAGLGHVPGVIQIEVPNLYSDVDMTNLNNTINYNWGCQTGDLDLGDVHEDKDITAFSLGCAVQNKAVLLGSVAAMSPNDGQGLQLFGYSRSKNIQPSSPQLGSFLLGPPSAPGGNAAYVSQANNFTLPTWQPNPHIMGRAFRATFTGTPTSPGFVRISDLEFRVRKIPRRATDLAVAS